MPQGDLITPTAQNEHGYDIDPVLLGALAKAYVLKKSGLVYERIFSPVNTNGACDVAGFDFTVSVDTNGDETHRSMVDALQKNNDVPATCYSEADEVDAPNWAKRLFHAEEYREKILLTECCAHMCGVSDADYMSMIENSKLSTLLNRYLISREIKGIDLITGGGVGAWNAGWEDGDLAVLMDCTDMSESPEGKAYDLTGQDICDPEAFDLLTLSENVQAKRLEVGAANYVAMNKLALNAFKRNDSFKGKGCVLDPRTPLDSLKAQMGVQEIYIADAIYNTAAFGMPRVMAPIWGAGFVLFYQRMDGLQSMTQPELMANFAVDLKIFNEYFRTFREDEKGRDGVEWLQFNYSYTPAISNIKAGTLFHGLGA